MGLGFPFCLFPEGPARNSSSLFTLSLLTVPGGGGLCSAQGWIYWAYCKFAFSVSWLLFICIPIFFLSILLLFYVILIVVIHFHVCELMPTTDWPCWCSKWAFFFFCSMTMFYMETWFVHHLFFDVLRYKGRQSINSVRFHAGNLEKCTNGVQLSGRTRICMFFSSPNFGFFLVKSRQTSRPKYFPQNTHKTSGRCC